MRDAYAGAIYHEAGHAVAAALLGADLESVSIGPSDRSLGRTVANGRERAMVLVALAGGIAGTIAAGKQLIAADSESAGFSASDCRAIVAPLEDISEREERDEMEIVRKGTALVLDILIDNWHYVESVAAALCEFPTMTGDEFAERMRGCRIVEGPALIEARRWAKLFTAFEINAILNALTGD